MRPVLLRPLLVVLSLLVGVVPPGLRDAAAAADPSARSTRNLSVSPNESAWNRVAASGDDVHVVWQDRSYTSGGGGAVLYRRSTDRGTTWEDPRILTSRRFDAVHPTVASSGDDVYIAWHEATPFDPKIGSREIHVAASRDGGDSFDVVQVSDDHTDSLDPSLTIDEAGGVHVAWNDAKRDVWVASSSDGGSSYTERVVARGADYGAPTQAAAVAGAVLVAYEAGRSVHVVRLRVDAQQADAPQLVGPGGHLDGLAAWGTGAHVAYRTRIGSDGSRGVLHVATSTDGGAQFAPSVELDRGVNDPYYENVDVVADGGEVAVLWGAPVSDAEPDEWGLVPGPRGLYVARSRDGGRSWGGAQTLRTGARAYLDVRLAVMHRTAARTTPQPALTWRVPERFGPDADGDGMVDYVTTAEQLAEQTYPVTLDGCASTGGDSPLATYAWRIDGEQHTTPTCTFEHVFAAEGTHDVELEVTTDDGDTVAQTFPVVVEDLLVVSLGDSVASGEGNPDHVQPGTLPWDPDARWQEPRCNRSAQAGPARAARLLEQRDPKTSVTFVHLACSGATVSEPDADSGGLLTSYLGIRPANPPLPPQLDQLRELITRDDGSKRTPDAVLVSIGANDLKFSKVIENCIKFRCPTSSVGEDLERRKAALPGRYDDLAMRLAYLVPPSRTFLTEYFDPTRNADGEPDLNCVGNGGLVFRITDEETAWAQTAVMQALNGMVHAAAQRHGWNVVGGISDGFGPHGYCAADSWVVQIGQSLVAQANHEGAFHPNAPGHAFYGKQIADAVAPALGLPAGRSADLAAAAVGPVVPPRMAAVFTPSRSDRLTVLPLDGTELPSVQDVPAQLLGSLRVAGSDGAVTSTWVNRPPGPDATTASLEVHGATTSFGDGRIAVRRVDVVQAPGRPSALVSGKTAVLRVEVTNGLGESLVVPLDYRWSGPDGVRSGRVDAGLHRGTNVLWVHGSSPIVPDAAIGLFSAEVTISADGGDDSDDTARSEPLPVRTTGEHRVLYVPLDTAAGAPSCVEVRQLAAAGGDIAADAMPLADGKAVHDASCETALTARAAGASADLAGTLRDLAGVARTGGYNSVVGVVPGGFFAAHTTEPQAGGVGLVGAGGAIVEVGTPLPVVVHELGHNLGLGHVTAHARDGYRVGTRQAREGGDVLDEAVTRDSWVSDTSFQAMADRLRPSVPAGLASSPRSMLVSGVLDVDGAVRSEPWQLVEAAPDDLAPGGELVLEQRDAGGELLRATSMPLSDVASVGAQAAGTSNGERAFVARVPFDEAAAELALVKDGDDLLVRPVTQNAPAVTLTAPTAGTLRTGQPVQVTWEATDADGDPLVADVAVTVDGGVTWRPVATGVTGGSAAFEPSQAMAGTTARVRVTVSDGVRSAAAESGDLSPRAGVGNGSLLFQYGQLSKAARSVESIEPDGSNRTTARQDGRDPDVSPDGAQLAWLAPQTYDDGTSATGLFVGGVGGADARPVLQDYRLDNLRDPSWSPDGTRLLMEACDATVPGQCGLWVVQLDSGEASLVVADEQAAEADWSPDGRRFAYTSRAQMGRFEFGPYSIWIRNADGTGATNLSLLVDPEIRGYHHNNPAWSPDGAQIAFDSSDGKGALTVRVVDVDGTDAREITTPETDRRYFFDPAWSPDGRSLAVIGNDPMGRGELDVPYDVWTFALDGSARTKVTAHEGTWRAHSVVWAAREVGAEPPPPPPVVPPLSAGGPYAAHTGVPLRLAAALGPRPDGSLPVLAWDLDGDGEFDDADGAAPQVVFDHVGPSTVRVRATDAAGSTVEAEAPLTVERPAPVVDAGPDGVGTPGVENDLRAARFTDPGGGEHTATVDWGDGETRPAQVEGDRVLARRELPAGVHDVVVRVCNDADLCGEDIVRLEIATGDPEVGGLAPETGPAAGGTRVRVLGERLGHADRVMFGDTAGRDLQVLTDGALEVTAPALPAGESVRVTVVTDAGTSQAVPAATWMPSNTPPDLTSTAVRTAVGAAIDIDLLAIDPDGDELALTVVQDPSHGTVDITGGRVRYTPDAGFAGTDRMQVEAADPAGSTASAWATVTVGSREPVARYDEVDLPSSGELRVPVSVLTGNDADPDGDAFTVTAVGETDETRGTVRLDGDHVVYERAAGATAGDAFRYVLTDATGVTAAGQVAVVSADGGPPPSPAPGGPAPGPQPPTSGPAPSPAPSPSPSPSPSSSPTATPPPLPSTPSPSTPTATAGPTPTDGPRPVPQPRPVDDSCPDGVVPEDGLLDVAAGSAHEAAVDCLVWWQVTHGRRAGEFDPLAEVTRGQMASFLARVLRSSGVQLPEGPDRFVDDTGSVHEPSINALAALGVVAGRDDGSFGVDAPMTRAQMASFLVRTVELLAGAVSTPGDDYFADDDGDPHEQAVNTAAALGVAAGVEGRSFQPGRPVRREQMASFLVRLLDLLVEDGHARPPAGGAG